MPLSPMGGEPQPKTDRRIFLISLLAAAQFLAAAVVILRLPADPKNALVLGFSLQRLAFVGFCLALSLGALAVGLSARRRGWTVEAVRGGLASSRWWLAACALLAGLAAWGWLSLAVPSYAFGRWMYVFERMRPGSAAVGLAALEVSALMLLSRPERCFRAVIGWTVRRYGLAVIISAMGIFGLAAFITITKIGVARYPTFWNVPGIPLAGLQVFGLVAATMIINLTAGEHLTPQPPLHHGKERHDGEGGQEKRAAGSSTAASSSPSLRSGEGAGGVRYILPFLIFLAAFLVWGFTPLVKDTLSVRPAAPQWQPYPAGDARVHDWGAVSVAEGRGILFHGYTDKPLYMVFLGALHLVAGYDYRAITWMQVAFLALIPVALFWFGRKYHSLGFGLLLAGAITLRLRNAIFLSDNVASVNPKLFMTEMPAMLGMALFTGLVFIWFRDRKPWLALLAGGALGAMSLVRLNPLILLPAVIALCAAAFWRAPWKMARHVGWFTLGALVLLLPWVIGGVSPNGTPWLYLKFLDVINVRYNQSAPGGLQSHLGSGPEVASLSGGFGLAAVCEFGITPGGCKPPAIGQKSLVNEAQNGSINSLSPFQQAFSPVARSFSFGLGVSQAAIIKETSAFSGNAFLIIRHFMHNLVTSVLALPDAIPYDDIRHLSKREYWVDANHWDGEIPTGQGLMIAGNLGLVALGVGYGWRRWGWAGLAPLYVFAVYTASLALAMNSGGRYIVPVDWIVYFYYLLAFVLIIQFVLRALGLRDSGYLSGEAAPVADPSRGRKALWTALAGLALLASVVPVSNNLVPALVRDQVSQPAAEDALLPSIPVDAARGESLLEGEILYPYHNEDGMIEFTILTPYGMQELAIEAEGYRAELSAGDRAIARVKTVDGKRSVETLYRVRGDLLELIWQQ